MRSVWFIIACLLLHNLPALSQPAVDLMRNGSIDLGLKGKEQKELKIFVDSLDVLSLTASTLQKANFTVKAPDGQVVFDARLEPDAEWNAPVMTTGAYTVIFENTNKFLSVKVNLLVNLNRPNFAIGDSTMVPDLRIEREVRSLLTAESEIIKANPASYPLPVQKGDTLNITLTPLKGKTPYMQLVSGQQEVLWSSWSTKRAEKFFMPVVSDDTYTLHLSTDALFKEAYKLTIGQITPAKYTAPPVVAKDSLDDGKSDSTLLTSYDTIPQLLIDTVLNLAARRNILGRYEQKLEIVLPDSADMLYWGVMYGVGSSYEAALVEMEPLLANENFQAVGATDVLSAYGLGLLKVLPRTSMRCITMTASADISANFVPPRNNYAVITSQKGKQFLSFVNECESVGQRIYVKAVVFKKSVK